MNKKTPSAKICKDIYFYWFAILSWSLLIIGSLTWNSWNSWQGTLERARSACRIATMKDMSYRAWVATKGGVYVPITEATPPNKYLVVPNRDISTVDGQKLTLVNPAYMSRQVFSLTEELYGLKGHITSLNLLNPGNAPDAWEEKVLKAVDRDNPKDVTELTQEDGEYFMRLLHPMVIEESCLKCHGEQGYEVGDIRGGLCFTLPVTSYIHGAKKTIALLFLVHIAFLFFGICIIKMFQNMNNARNFREKLERNEERLRTLINSTPDCILFKDGEGRWIESNLANLELFHLTETDYRDKKDCELAQFTHPMFREVFLGCEETDEEAWENGETSRCVEVVPKSDGTKNVYDVIKVPLFEDDGSRKGLIIFGRDITEQTQLRDKLVKAEKMEAIGLMAGGVAHDLNNILSGIVCYPELIMMDLPEENKHREMLKAIQNSGRRAAEVVADLLTVARGVAAPRVIENLNSIIRNYLESPECTKLLSLHWKVTFQTELNGDLANFSCSSVHIRKCLMNLVTNAVEAIAGNGVVTVSTANRSISEQDVLAKDLAPGQYVILCVTDTGPGISQMDLAHIFEPFYSKKVMGKSGTGLGLAVVWNTVRDHGGMVFVRAEDKGTVFEVYFPASLEPTDRAPETDLKAVEGQGDMILVVDDEAQQRDIAKRMLESLNYTVQTAASGEEAMEWLVENRADLVILDMIMHHGMNGCETYEKIIVTHPGQKAVIVSGYAIEKTICKAKKLGVGELIKKPYSLFQLGDVVRRALTAHKDS